MKILRGKWKRVYIPAGIQIKLDEPLEAWIKEKNRCNDSATKTQQK